MIMHVLNFFIWAMLAVVVAWPICAWAARSAPPRHMHLRAFKPGEMIFTPPDVVLHDHVKAKMGGFADLPLMPFGPPESGWEAVADVDPAAIYKKWNKTEFPPGHADAMKGFMDTFGGHDERPSTVVHRRALNTPPDLRTSFNRRCRYTNCGDRFPCADCAVIRGEAQ